MIMGLHSVEWRGCQYGDERAKRPMGEGLQLETLYPSQLSLSPYVSNRSSSRSPSLPIPTSKAFALVSVVWAPRPARGYSAYGFTPVRA